MAKVLSWKTVVVGAGMVAMASFFDFYHTGEQVKILRGLRACKVSYTTLSADSLTKALREHAKKNHPDLGGVSEIGACTVDETNELRAGVRKHGVGWLAWILYKLNIAPSRVEAAIMFTFIGAGCVCTAAVRRLPPRYSRWLVTLGLLHQGETASTERQLMKKLKHAEFIYGLPPCATVCGDTPSQCTVGGWMYRDMYVFWNDAGTCKHFKITTPTESMSSWSRSAFWGGVARFAANLQDGFQAEDVLALASGYWVKQYHDELSEDLQQIKGSMAMLGDAPEDEEDGDQVRKEL
jgi:hypothetical protein